MSTQNPFSATVDFGRPPLFPPSQFILQTPSPADYPSMFNRHQSHSRSQLNLALLSKLTDVVRAMFPHAAQHNRRIYGDMITVYLDHEIDPSFPGGIVNPGYWCRYNPGYRGLPAEIGADLISLYARKQNIPDYFAESVLWAYLDLSTFNNAAPLERSSNWVWETRPLTLPLENPFTVGLPPVKHAYFGRTSLPILWAAQTFNNFGPMIRYFALMRRETDPAAHWVEAIPPGELPLFGTIFSIGGGPLSVRMVPSEFDPRFQCPAGREVYCAVPGGAANIARTGLSALAGHHVHLELLPDELVYSPGIIDALGPAHAADVTVSLIGEPETFPLDQLREVASRRGYDFPLPTLPEPMMPDNSLITAGSPLPPSNTPRRFLLKPVIPEGGLVWLYAREKVGKTWLALSIAQAVSQGGTLGPWQAPKPASVLYIDGEMHPDDLQTAIAKVTRGQGNHATVGFNALCAKKVKGGVINLLDPIWQEEIARRAKDVDLLIFDNFYSLTNNNVGEFPDVLGFLQRLRALGTAVLVIDHTNRDGVLQGAHTKERAAETVIELRIPEGRNWRENVRAIEVTKARHYIPEAADYFLGEMVFTEDSFRFEAKALEIPAGPEPIPAEIAKLAPVVIARDIDDLSYAKTYERLRIPRSTASDWYKRAKDLNGPEKEALDREIRRLLEERKGLE